MSRIRRSRAFTLIELIVVVIIIGVLAGIAAVAYNQFVAQANTKANVASVRNVAQVMDAASAQENAIGSAVATTYTDPAFQVGTTTPVKVSVHTVPTATLDGTTHVFTIKANCLVAPPTSAPATSAVTITGCWPEVSATPALGWDVWVAPTGFGWWGLPAFQGPGGAFGAREVVWRGLLALGLGVRTVPGVPAAAVGAFRATEVREYLPCKGNHNHASHPQLQGVHAH